MSGRQRRIAAAVALLALLAACAPTPTPAPAERPRFTVVSLNPCVDAILAEVADPAQILALSRFSRDPGASSLGVERARRFPVHSGTVEEIVALRPDLVIGDTFVPGPAGSAALARLGIRMERFTIETDVGQSRDQIRRLAALVGEAARGEVLVKRIDTALARAAPPPGAEPVSAVVWQGGGIVPGERTLIADLLRRTGFRNFSAARGLGQADVLPLEQMLADPPALILAAGDRRADENRLLSHPALSALDGTTREGFPSNLLWCGGPTIARAAARLTQVRGRAAGHSAVEP